MTAADAQAFAAGLARLVSDGRLREELGERGLKFVNEHHSKERLVNDIKNLYAELTPWSAALSRRFSSRDEVKLR